MILINLIFFVTQIADGMSYIGQHKYVLIDLAAKNVLVADNNVVKIATLESARLADDDEHQGEITLYSINAISLKQTIHVHEVHSKRLNRNATILSRRGQRMVRIYVEFID